MKSAAGRVLSNGSQHKGNFSYSAIATSAIANQAKGPVGEFVGKDSVNAVLSCCRGKWGCNRGSTAEHAGCGQTV